MKTYIKVILISCSLQSMATDTVCFFKLGVENISPELIRCLSSQRIGLITNQTGCNQAGKPTVDILQEQGITVSALLVPEHGIDGTVAAERDIQDSRDHKRSLPIISLYGNGTGKHISDQVLHMVDAFIFDIQDVGMRHYTYISTLFYALEAAAHHKKMLVVFDRPNPLGRMTEGPLVDEQIKSFIAVAPIPLRHGMTVGELAHYFNNTYFNKRACLHVVTMSGYTGKHINKSRLNLSPNIQTLDACYGYSFLGLLGEIRPFDVGIGTPLAFQCITLAQELKVPQSFWTELRTILAKHTIHSDDFAYYSTRKKKHMVGLRIAIRDICAVSTCSLLAAIIASAKKYGVTINFSKAFDTAIGTERAREGLENPRVWATFMQKVSIDVQNFCKHARSCYLYEPAPVCIVPILGRPRDLSVEVCRVGRPGQTKSEGGDPG